MWRNLTALSLMSTLLFSTATPAASYPDRPIRWVLGFAPAGAPDLVARIVSPQLSAQLGQSVVLDNRPGANGILGAELVARANPDAYTLLVTPAAFAINPSWYGVFAPAKTPAAIVTRPHKELRATLNVPAVRDRLAAIGMQPVGNTPVEFKAFVATAIKRYAELVKLAGIQSE